jgi:hypothetical protein
MQYNADGLYTFFRELAEPRFEAFFPGVSQWSLLLAALWRGVVVIGGALIGLGVLIFVRVWSLIFDGCRCNCQTKL